MTGNAFSCLYMYTLFLCTVLCILRQTDRQTDRQTEETEREREMAHRCIEVITETDVDAVYKIRLPV